jgi:hypothetical protein
MFDKLTREVLISLRGNDNRKNISNKMGFSYNQYFKFEAGYKKLKFEDFVNLCEVVGDINLIAIFRESLDLNLSDLSQIHFLENFCDFWGVPSGYVLEKELNISSSKWWRLKNGKTSMTFVDLLKLIDVMSGRLLNFLEALIGKSKVDQLFENNYNAHQALTFLKNYPESSLITTGVYTDVYLLATSSQRMKVLQELTKIPEDRFDSLVEMMLAKKICYEENGLLKATTFMTELRSLEVNVGRSLFNYILIQMQKENAQMDVDSKNRKIRCNYKVTSVSKTTKQEVLDEMEECYKRINEILQADCGQERDEIILFQQAILSV